MNSWRDRVISLAGVFQAAELVDKLAKTGQVSGHDLETAVRGLYCLTPKDTTEVFGSLSNVKLGLESLVKHLEKQQRRSDNMSLSYVMSLLHLQKKLSKQNDMMSIIGSRLDQSKHQLEHFGPTSENTIAGLAGIYSDTISTLSFRIKVNGNYEYLKQDRIANQVRALLFFGIRSAVLWRQNGGSRLNFIFKRTDMLSQAKQILGV